MSRAECRALIDRLRLVPHPEGGWYRECHRSPTLVGTPDGARAAVTTIYYLLEHHQISRWHVIDAEEIWHFYAGTSLELLVYSPATGRLRTLELGHPLEHETVAVVGPDEWQAARVATGFALVGCTVAPAFRFEGFQFVSSLPDHRRHFDGVLAPYATLL